MSEWDYWDVSHWVSFSAECRLHISQAAGISWMYFDTFEPKWWRWFLHLDSFYRSIDYFIFIRIIGNTEYWYFGFINFSLFCIRVQAKWFLSAGICGQFSNGISLIINSTKVALTGWVHFSYLTKRNGSNLANIVLA